MRICMSSFVCAYVCRVLCAHMYVEFCVCICMSSFVCAYVVEFCVRICKSSFVCAYVCQVLCAHM